MGSSHSLRGIAGDGKMNRVGSVVNKATVLWQCLQFCVYVVQFPTYVFACLNIAINVVMCLCRREEFMQWTESLGDSQTPSWLGLPNSAETVLLTSLGMLSSCSC